MKINITDLLIIFDELLIPPTNEEQGIYWFRKSRNDHLIITLSCYLYENNANILICKNLNTAIASISMKNCSEIRVLDEGKTQFEIVHDNLQSRCFIDLSSNDILSYTE